MLSEWIITEVWSREIIHNAFICKIINLYTVFFLSLPFYLVALLLLKPLLICFFFSFFIFVCVCLIYYSRKNFDKHFIKTSATCTYLYHEHVLLIWKVQRNVIFKTIILFYQKTKKYLYFVKTPFAFVT